MQEGFQVTGHGISQLFVPVLLANVGDIQEHAAGGFKLRCPQRAPGEEEGGGVREVSYEEIENGYREEDG